MTNVASEICRLLHVIPKHLISLTHGRMVPLDVVLLMGLQEKLFRGPVLKQQDF